MTSHRDYQITRAQLYLSVFFLTGALILPEYCFSQDHQSFQSERDLVVSTTWLRLGPLYLTPRVLFNVTHDSNIFGSVATENPVGDYLATMSLPIRASLLYRNWLVISFLENPTYYYYFQLRNQRSLANSYSAGTKLFLFNRVALSGDFESVTQTERLTSEMDRRNTQTTDGYKLSLFLETPNGTALGFSGSSRKYSYGNATLPYGDVPLSVALDRVERNARVEFYHGIFSDAQFFSNFGYTEYVFSSTEAGYRDSHSYQAYTGIGFPFLRSRARGTLSIGYKKFVPERMGFKGFSGIVGDTSFSIRTGRFQWRLVFIRDIPFSFGTNIFFIYDNYGGGLSYYLSRNIRLNYNYNQGSGDYPEPQEIRSPDGNAIEIMRRDTYQSHSAGVVIRIYRSTGIGLSVDYSKRDSNFSLASIDRTSYGAYITYTF